MNTYTKRTLRYAALPTAVTAVFLTSGCSTNGSEKAQTDKYAANNSVGKICLQAVRHEVGSHDATLDPKERKSLAAHGCADVPTTVMTRLAQDARHEIDAAQDNVTDDALFVAMGVLALSTIAIGVVMNRAGGPLGD